MKQKSGLVERENWNYYKKLKWTTMKEIQVNFLSASCTVVDGK